MHRLLLLAIALIFCAHSCEQKKKFSITIKGKVLNADKATKIHFVGENIRKIPLGPDKSFEYTDKLTFPLTMLIRLDDSYGVDIWANEGEINLTLEEYVSKNDSTGRRRLRIVDISGQPETVKREQLNRRWSELVKKYTYIPVITERADSIINAIYPEVRDYVSTHPLSQLSPSLIYSYPFSADKKQYLLSLLDSNLNSYTIKNIEHQIKRSALLKPGNLIPDWKQETIDGTMFSLYSLKADYILMEFWASNCFPCRQTNPALIKIYNRYHSKGFDIIGISLDVKKDLWKKAIEKDQLPWIQVSDLQGNNNAVASAFAVDGIPFNILLNSKYEIVATDLYPQALADKLKELLLDTD